MTPRLVTGERVVTAEGGFNHSWQRHVATYRLAAPHLRGATTVLDLGCGIGHSFRELGDDVTTVGVDIEPSVLSGQGRETHAADMRTLPFTEPRFDGLISVHSIEHVPDPERAVAEAARVLRPGSPAVWATPNRLTFARADEIIDPFHYVEFDPRELAAVLGGHFEDITVHGLFGGPTFDAIVAGEHARLDRMLRADPMRLRRFVPRRARQFLYDALLTRARTRGEVDPRIAEIRAEDFYLDAERPDEGFDLVAVCRRR